MNANTFIGECERFVALGLARTHRLRGPAQVRVTVGTVWLTVSGEPDDHILGPGDGYAVSPSSEAWLQGLSGSAGVVVAEPTPSWSRRAAATLRAAMRSLAEGPA